MFAQTRRALDALAQTSRALDPACLDGHDAAALVELAARGERICAAINARAARRVDETKGWREAGHRSAAHFVADTAGTTVGAAARAPRRRRPHRGLQPLAGLPPPPSSEDL